MEPDTTERRILFVCTANVCRSFMAAAITRQRATEAGLDLVVTSAGTAVRDIPVDPDARLVLRDMGIEVPDHRPRQLDRAIVRSDGRDLIVTMTRGHLREVVAADRAAWPRTFTLRELVRRLSSLTEMPDDWSARLAALGAGRTARDLMSSDPGDDISDPYGQSVAVHRESATVIGSLAGQLISSGLLRRSHEDAGGGLRARSGQ